MTNSTDAKSDINSAKKTLSLFTPRTAKSDPAMLEPKADTADTLENTTPDAGKEPLKAASSGAKKKRD